MTDASEHAAPERPVRTDKTWVYHACRSATWLGYRLALPPTFRGVEHLPKTGGVLVAANHQSFLDIPLIAQSTGRHVCFVARDTLAHSRLLAYIMNGCNAVLIGRGKGDRAALRAIVAHLEAGDCVAMFPEGTRTRDGTLGAFHSGALVAARKAGVPLVPAAIDGSWRAWPPGRSLPRPTRLSLEYAPAVDSALPDALERVRAAIAERLPPAARPHPPSAPDSESVSNADSPSARAEGRH
ncbi:MAG: 1-acyl-sn-glycerol-3-phosphate acyltransferase [Planctomycetes bacterium]|nr:1-acyl-sn-glycerol-3-phosphate acyltransferase [Planctomycetota bacterium]